ncbi:uncharacterized protein LOC132552156 [Ylistrum balloti]|uniref:uncharacterized protein LOC132552156 n=1 Tax=Ylistrum balloti TaxID=509963 RepID=UPI002905F178|nr:uncharacterized protein LOC132552156 [Ylistrum balloti]
MKALLVLFFLCVIGTNCGSLYNDILLKLGRKEAVLDSELDALAHANPDDLPDAVRKLVRSLPQGQHLCCRNKPVIIETKSRKVQRVRAVLDTVATSHKCGFLNTGHCSSTDEVYRQETFYVTEYYTHVRNGDCPDRHIVCCNMYIMVSESCVHLDDLHELTTQLVG